jgi:hypothetical protein
MTEGAERPWGPSRLDAGTDGIGTASPRDDAVVTSPRWGRAAGLVENGRSLMTSLPPQSPAAAVEAFPKEGASRSQ